MIKNKVRNKTRKHYGDCRSNKKTLTIFSFFDNPAFLITAAVIIIGAIVFTYCKDAVIESPIFRICKIHSVIKFDPEIEASIIGRSIFSFNVENLYYQIEHKYPEYKDISIVKQFPDAVLIDIKKRSPVAQIKTDKFYLINQEGVILSDGSNEAFDGLIPIEISSTGKNFTRGGVLRNRQFFQALELIKALKQKKIIKRFVIKNINASSPEAMNFTIFPVNIFLGEFNFEDVNVIIGNGDYDRKLYIFDNVLKENLHNDISRVTYIDLRYKKAYIGYKR